MVDILLEEAKKQGYTPDASVAGDEVVHGARPNPFMVYRNLDLLGVTPIQSVVKVSACCAIHAYRFRLNCMFSSCINVYYYKTSNILSVISCLSCTIRVLMTLLVRPCP